MSKLKINPALSALLLTALLLLGAVIYREANAEGPTPSANTGANTGANAAANSTESADKSTTIYSPSGKRDPFQAPVLETDRSPSSLSELERYGLEQLQLRGVIRGAEKPKAMFEDPEGKTYIIGEGEIVGRERGTVSRILDTEVIVTMRTFNYLGAENIYEKVISLPTK